ncbi:Nuclear cap-binding protein subunit 1 [Geranomyces variabilis]|uniref:Nuclear cap-binding protein subunit 1 n=1 Tax=Geranomyces variabilis TaxID=109894 RepID=A0AAD5TTQ9_9FUNG|nr:Nuclear cap-binding protein subunit 1 [Geranomyces variabilis]
MSYYNNSNGGGGYQPRDGYGGGQHRNRNFRNRRYQDAEPEKSIEEIKQEEIIASLFRLGDSSDHFVSAIETAASKFISEHQSYPALVKKALEACIPQMPHKASLYALFSGVVNAQSSEIGAIFIEVAHQTTQKALETNDFRTVKIMLRYLAELVTVGMVRATHIIAAYNTLLSVVHEPGVRVERSDAFVYAVLASVPWAAGILNTEAPEQFTEILLAIETYMNARRANFANTDIPRAMRALATYRDVPADWPFEQIDQLESLWRQIIDMKESDGWAAKILWRSAGFDAVLSTQAKHDFESFKIVHGENDVKFSYQPVLRLFDDSLQTPDNAIIHLPSTRTISRFILEDLIRDIIRIFSLNHREACRILFSLDLQLDPTFLEADKIHPLASVVESLFTEMLRLPRSGERSVYYATVLMDMIKEDMKNVPKMIGRAIKALYSRLDGPADLGGGMDIEAVRRLTEWFAIHLSNFGFVWNWDAWAAVLDVERESTSFVFVRETLERAVRLAYWERVQGTIPVSFAECEDVFPQQAPRTNFKYEDGDAASPLHTLVAQLRKTLAAKAPVGEVSKILNEIAALPTSMEETASPQDIAREAFVQCVMLQGSKSFSHVLNVVERYIVLLREQNASDAARAHTVRIVVDFWKYNTQFLEIILDKLTNYRVIDPKCIVSWVLDPAVLETNYTRFHIWAILRTTLAKVNFKVEQLTKKADAKRAKDKEAGADGAGDPMVEDGGELFQLDEARTTALREQKETFLHVFQKFIDVMAAAASSPPDSAFQSPAYARWVIGNMREVARGFPNEVKAYRHTLDAIVFTPDVDARCLEMWTDVKAIYDIHTNVLI